MAIEPTILERAFALARGGTCRNADEVRRKLKAERYDQVDAHVNGGLARQIAALCKQANTPSS